MKKILIILPLVIVLVVPTLAYADTPDPDSAPSLERLDVYRNLLETGDRCYIWEANIPYATTPDTLVTETFYWELLDTDGVTVLGTTTGYAYNSDGYGYNVYSMYFDAADALTWEATYTLRLSGNPAVFDVPPQYSFPVNVSDYTSLTDSDANKAALADTIIQIASDLDARWGLSTTSTLVLETESSTVLSIYGESVFRGSVYGCQALAPAAFRFIIEDLDAADRTWNLNYSGNLSAQYSGTWIDPAKTAGGTIFGVGYDLLSIIITLGMCIGLIWCNIKITNDHWNALMDVAIVLVTAPKIDLFPLTFTALVCAMAAMYTGTKVKSFIG